jgi:type I restriction enzyme S subunit
MEDQLVPELRFEGFEGEWEKQFLHENATFYKGKGLSKKDMAENGRLPCIRYAELYTR